jgi:hypothetical protein
MLAGLQGMGSDNFMFKGILPRGVLRFLAKI